MKGCSHLLGALRAWPPWERWGAEDVTPARLVLRAMLGLGTRHGPATGAGGSLLSLPAHWPVALSPLAKKYCGPEII